MIGKLIKQPAGYLAFIPNKFPGKIEIDMNKRSLNEMQYWAAHYLAKLDGVTQLLPDLDFFIFMYVKKKHLFQVKLRELELRCLILLELMQR